MTRKDVDVKDSKEANDERHEKDQDGQNNDQTKGNRSTREQDWAKNPVVHHVKDVIKRVQGLVDKVGFVRFVGVAHAKNLVV
jgi:hypothetical protein